MEPVPIHSIKVTFIIYVVKYKVNSIEGNLVKNFSLGCRSKEKITTRLIRILLILYRMT